MPHLGRWAVPLVLVTLGAAVAWLAPAERTLGAGIRWVYVHVSLVWAGSLALALAGAGGMVVLASARSDHAAWVRALWRAGLATFAAGIGFSMVAAWVNWGVVFLAEPRMAASLRFLASATILDVLAMWLPRPRVIGGLAAATLVLLAIDVGGARLVMHPKDPVRTATSAPIQATFALGFAIATALTTWGVVQLRPRPA